MARMIPSILDPDTKSPAERVLYESLRDDLDEDYTVFHSVAWQALNKEGRIRDGETDFVIAHSKRGILALEAKGGRITFDAKTRAWASISRGDQRVHPISDPFKQAKTSKYLLRDLIDKDLDGGRNPYNLGHAVAFPDVTVLESFLGPDRPREIILDQSDLGDLSGWVGRCLAYYRGRSTQAETAPTEAIVEYLVEAIGRSWELSPRMWGEFQAEARQFIRLTEQQYRILDLLSRYRRAAICGCAGSGKTMIAVEKATRLAKQGFRTLLTCFNKTLALDLGLSLGAPANLTVLNFHDLCAQVAEKAGNLPDPADEEAYYDRLLPEALIPAAEKLGERYDAIVVDEGQDFRDHWWIPLQFLLKEPDEGILYIFYDDNQRIYVPESSFPIQTPPHTLTVNCRNTQAIHNVVNAFYRSEDRPVALGPAGRPVEVVRFQNRQEMLVRLREVLGHLSAEGIPPGEIAVLTMLARQANAARQESSMVEDDIPSPTGEFPWRMTADWPPGPGEVYCATVHAFKGLERSVVILAGIESWMLESWSHLNDLLYVGSSRARHHLVVILSENSAAALGDRLGEAR